MAGFALPGTLQGMLGMPSGGTQPIVGIGGGTQAPGTPTGIGPGNGFGSMIGPQYNQNPANQENFGWKPSASFGDWMSSNGFKVRPGDSQTLESLQQMYQSEMDKERQQYVGFQQQQMQKYPGRTVGPPVGTRG